MGVDEPIDPRWASCSRRRRRRKTSQTRTPPATMARNPSTTITAIAQCGKAELSLDSWMLPDGDEDTDEADTPEALDPKDATEAVERVERVEREDCDIEETTESAYVVSGWTENRQERIHSVHRSHIRIAKKVGFVVCEPSSPSWFVMIQ
jgi:hypothetical protein